MWRSAGELLHHWTFASNLINSRQVGPHGYFTEPGSAGDARSDMTHLHSSEELKIEGVLQTQNAVDDAWLGIGAAEDIRAALNGSLKTLAADDSVIRTLQARGVESQFIERAIRSDLQRLAHALTLLVCHPPEPVFASVLPGHLREVLQGLDYRLDHVGREILCPPDALLSAWHRAREILGFPCAPGKDGGAAPREDLIFPSVQVVKAIRHDDPTVEAVTIAASFLCPSEGSEPVYVELFFPGHRDGSAAQHASHMESRLASLRCDLHRVVKPRLPICHLSVEIKDRDLLTDIHRLASDDATGLVTPYADTISINPGDNSHNTKLAVRTSLHPSAPVNLLEFIYFDC